MSSNGANRNIIWAESAKVKGLVDTTDGIKFIPSSADNEDETELALINNNVTTESFAAPHQRLATLPVEVFFLKIM